MGFSVRNHELIHSLPGEIEHHTSPNAGGKLVDPVFLIIHYTGGKSFRNAVDWLCTARPPDKASSAHLVIGREGEVAQLVTFNVRAWHAGKSAWGVEKHQDKPPTAKYVGLNKYSIGIELDNPGPLNRHGDGEYHTTFGARVKPEHAVIAMHRNPAAHWNAWHEYPSRQIDKLLDVADAVIHAYPSIQYVLGHDDIAPGRKFDPGPAFPMHRAQSQLLGRALPEDGDSDAAE